jgi:hypothetical protein
MTRLHALPRMTQQAARDPRYTVAARIAYAFAAGHQSVTVLRWPSGHTRVLVGDEAGRRTDVAAVVVGVYGPAVTVLQIVEDLGAV